MTVEKLTSDYNEKLGSLVSKTRKSLTKILAKIAVQVNINRDTILRKEEALDKLKVVIGEDNAKLLSEKKRAEDFAKELSVWG